MGLCIKLLNEEWQFDQARDVRRVVEGVFCDECARCPPKMRIHFISKYWLGRKPVT